MNTIFEHEGQTFCADLNIDQCKASQRQSLLSLRIGTRQAVIFDSVGMRELMSRVGRAVRFVSVTSLGSSKKIKTGSSGE